MTPPFDLIERSKLLLWGKWQNERIHFENNRSRTGNPRAVSTGVRSFSFTRRRIGNELGKAQTRVASNQWLAFASNRMNTWAWGEAGRNFLILFSVSLIIHRNSVADNTTFESIERGGPGAPRQGPRTAFEMQIFRQRLGPFLRAASYSARNASTGFTVAVRLDGM